MSIQDGSFKDFVALVPKDTDSPEFTALHDFVAVYRLQPVEKQNEEQQEPKSRTNVKRAQVKLRAPVAPIGGTALAKETTSQQDKKKSSKSDKPAKKKQEKRKKNTSDNDDDDNVAEEQPKKKKQKKNK